MLKFVKPGFLPWLGYCQIWFLPWDRHMQKWLILYIYPSHGKFLYMLSLICNEVKCGCNLTSSCHSICYTLWVYLPIYHCISFILNSMPYIYTIHVVHLCRNPSHTWHEWELGRTKETYITLEVWVIWDWVAPRKQCWLHRNMYPDAKAKFDWVQQRFIEV